MHRRLTELESRAAINNEPSPIIAVEFVEPNGRFGGRERCSDRASELMGELVWDRRTDETQEQFQRRVTADVPQRKGPNCTVIVFWQSSRHPLTVG